MRDFWRDLQRFWLDIWIVIIGIVVLTFGILLAIDDSKRAALRKAENCAADLSILRSAQDSISYLRRHQC